MGELVGMAGGGGYLRAARACNFAGLLPIVDRLFGTLHLPEDQWPKTYGTDDAVPETYAGQLQHPFR